MRTAKWRYSLLLILTVFLLLPARAAGEEVPALSAEAAILVEPVTGRVLFEKNADRPMKAASTVKILTALVALEHLDSAQEVTVDRAWTGIEGSSMYLRPGETVTVRDLLYGLLLVSGNDAATALACAAAGSVEAFTELMNGKAAALGMGDSRFADPCGLVSEGHQVTARDMATLTRAALENELIAEIVATKTAVAADRSFTNHNKLLWRYEGAAGVKTGFTKAAGRTLVSCAERCGLRLICVTLNDPDDWEDHAALLDWGFANYAWQSTGEMTWSLPVVSGLGESAPVVPGREEALLLPKDGAGTWSVALPDFVYAPVSKGEKAGLLRFLTPGGEVLAEIPLVFAEDVGLDPAQSLSFLEKLKWAWFFAWRHSPPYPINMVW